MKNKIEDLRNVLFETLDDLRDKEKPMEIARARAIVDVAQVIVDSAKAENDFIRFARSKGTGFITPQPVDAGAIRAAVEAGTSTPRQLKPAGGEVSRTGRVTAGRCPDPNCGGSLSPQTNGNGGLKDVCDKCHRSVPAKELATA